MNKGDVIEAERVSTLGSGFDIVCREMEQGYSRFAMGAIGYDILVMTEVDSGGVEARGRWWPWKFLGAALSIERQGVVWLEHKGKENWIV